ncbi:MAG: integrase [Pyrinomonadaceae bacterium]|nr:integrase [Pyrinomonadaceae bacterium]
MASIKPRGKNKWFVRVFLRREQGKIKFHDKLINGNKKDADAYARKIETARGSGTLDELLNPPTLTLDSYLDRWLKESVKPSVRENTYNDYHDILKRYVRPSLGSRTLVEIRPPDVQAIYNALKERGLSTRTIQYTHAVLTSALKQAVGWQLLKLNPADYTKRPKNESDELDTAETEKIKVLTVNQAEQFLESAKADSMGAALIFALATGARPEEYLALRWADVDFERGEVRIQQVVQWHRKTAGGGWYFLPPKTKKSRRTLRVTESVLQIMQEHRRGQMLQRLKRGARYQQLDLVFATIDGTPFQRRNLHRRHMLPILTAAKLDNSLYLYCLRHTFATLALADGLDPKEVSMMMGHSSVAFTQDKYQHVLPSMREATSKRLEKLLFKNRIAG